MKKILLTQGMEALVDDEDYCELSRNIWFAVRFRKWWYAARSSTNAEQESGYPRMLYMHRQILGLALEGQAFADHIDRNGLNNTRKNLRRATHAENQRNSGRPEGSKRPYKGVQEKKLKNGRSRWVVQLNANSKCRYVGTFDDAISAAKAYDSMARLLYGEFACTNFPD